MELVVSSVSPACVEFAELVAENLDLDLVNEPKLVTAISYAAGAADLAQLFIFVENIFQIRQYKDQLSQINANRIHVFVPAGSHDVCEFVFQSGVAANVVYDRFDDIENESIRYSQIIRGVDLKVDPDMKNLIVNSRVKTIELRRLAEKSFLTDTVSYFLMANQCSERVSHSVASAADELLLNAIVALDMASESEISSNVELSKQPVFLQMAAQNEYIGVGVTAMQNSTNREKVYSNLASAFANLKKGKGESGAEFSFALSLILRTGASLRFTGSEKGFLAIAILFRRSQTILDFKTQFQFVSSLFV